MPYLRRISLHCTLTLIILLIGIVSGVFHQCVKETSCKCNAGVGWSVDLSPLDAGKLPRFSVPLPATLTSTSNLTIYYHPCQSFWAGNQSVGQCGNGDGVAVCLVEVFHNAAVPSIYSDLGVNINNTFNTTGSFPKENVTITFTSANGTINTTLNLKCEPEEKNGKLRLADPTHPQTNPFALILESRYACANAVVEDGLSVGSILLIMFFVLLMFYLLVGMVYNRCVMGASGFEIFPHYEFWIDFPFLVRDGIIFLFTGCKTEPSYDRI